MAQNKGFSLDFKGFLDLAEDISERYGDEALLEATEQALDETRKYVNAELREAMKSSKYSFTESVGYSQGEAMRSLAKVESMPIETSGTIVTAYAGFDLEEAPEALILAYGSPHLAKDTRLYNAIKVKGKVKNEVALLQHKVFTAALEGGTGNGTA
jgi:hypothetical protein